jgi:hypothetical protein
MKRCTVALSALAFLLGALTGCGSSSSDSDSSEASAPKPAASGWKLNVVDGPETGEFESVACPAEGDCWATANIERAEANSGEVFHLEGEEWAHVPSPPASSLYGIACPRVTSCWAVGAFIPAGEETVSTLIEHFDGSSWKVEPSPNAPEFPESGLTGIACSTATDCWAVGDGEDFAQEPTAGGLLLVHYDGNAWSEVQAPSPQREVQTGAGHGALIECPSTTQCILLTNFGIEAGRGIAEAADIYDGDSWRSLVIPPGILFQGFSCAAVDDCQAIGGPGFDGPMSTYGFDGQVWSRPVPLPGTAEGQSVSWYSLACPVSEDCWAAGGGPISGEGSVPAVVAHLEEGRWEMPDQPEAAGELTGIACSSPASCSAVGGASASSYTPSSKPLAFQLVP